MSINLHIYISIYLKMISQVVEVLWALDKITFENFDSSAIVLL